jgi:hypothetical protein
MARRARLVRLDRGAPLLRRPNRWPRWTRAAHQQLAGGRVLYRYGFPFTSLDKRSKR